MTRPLGPMLTQRRTELVVAFLRDTGGATLFEIGQKHGWHTRTVRRYMRHLERLGAVEVKERDCETREKIWALVCCPMCGCVQRKAKAAE